MPAESASQQHLFGWIKDTPASQLPPHEREMKERMTPAQIRAFAATSTKGLPEHVERKRRHAHLPRAAARVERVGPGRPI